MWDFWHCGPTKQHGCQWFSPVSSLTTKFLMHTDASKLWDMFPQVPVVIRNKIKTDILTRVSRMSTFSKTKQKKHKIKNRRDVRDDISTTHEIHRILMLQILLLNKLENIKEMDCVLYYCLTKLNKGTWKT